MADASPERPRHRRVAVTVRYVGGILLGLLVLVLLFGKRGELVAAFRQLGHASLPWAVAAVCAEGCSIAAFALLQHRVLRLSGTVAPFGGLFAMSLANDAIANSVPGEPAVSGAYRYRHYRRFGATGAGAGWTLFTIFIAQSIAMSLLLLCGVVVAFATSRSTKGAAAAVVGIVIVVAAGAILARRDLVLRLAGAAVRASRRVTGHPRTSAAQRVERVLDRMREIPLSRASAVAVVAVAGAVWALDFCCLLCSFAAVHAAVPFDGVLLAYGVAQIVSSLPVIPGGIGIVEGSLAVVLVAYGTARVPALSVALMFRAVSFWLAVAIGWVAFGAIAMHLGRSRAAGLGEVVSEGGAVGVSPVPPSS